MAVEWIRWRIADGRLGHRAETLGDWDISHDLLRDSSSSYWKHYGGATWAGKQFLKIETSDGHWIYQQQ